MPHVYTYDPNGQVTGETDSGGVSYSVGNTYDPNGNRTGTGFSTFSDNELGDTPTDSYVYDNDGNRVEASAGASSYNIYTFDTLNRLTNVTAPSVSQSVAYTYDPDDNQRIEEADITTTGSVYTEFTYNGGGKLVMEQDGSNHATDLYLLDATGGTAPLAHEDSSGNITWLLTDQNGSVQTVVDNSGNVDQADWYDAFGNEKITYTNGTPSVFGFQGMMQQLPSAPSGIFALDYDNARWYDPQTEIFVSQDPKGFGGGTPNLYEFVADDPVNNTDPTGMMPAQARLAPFTNGNPAPFQDVISSLITSSGSQNLTAGLNSTGLSGGSLGDYVNSLDYNSPPTDYLNQIMESDSAEFHNQVEQSAALDINSSVGVNYNDISNPVLSAFLGDSSVGNVTLNPTVQTVSTGAKYVAIGSAALATGGVAGEAYAGWLGADAAVTFSGTVAAGGINGLVTSGVFNAVTQLGQNQPFSVSSLAQSTAQGAGYGMGGSALGYAAGSLFTRGLTQTSENTPIGTPSPYGNLTPAQMQQIQTFVNNKNVPVTVVGSQAAGTAGPLSDFDYIIPGNSALRSSAQYYLPKGPAGGAVGGSGPGSDILNGNNTPLDPTLPHIIFTPGNPPVVGGK